MQILKYILVFVVYICFSLSYFLIIRGVVSAINDYEKDTKNCSIGVIILWLICAICIFIVENMNF